MMYFFLYLWAMNFIFYKYQGAGNDFIFIDNRDGSFPKQNSDLVVKLCDRNFGIGADGLVLIENHSTTDFEMIYYNADSGQTMCGNGARCAVAFARKLNIIGDTTFFTAFDGPHKAKINKNQTVSLEMIDVDKVEVKKNYVFINTGTTHHVEMVEDLDKYPVVSRGRKLRYEMYGKSGSNINFIEKQKSDTFGIRTYEKGVENETLACGTGVTAAAIAMHKTGQTTSNTINLIAKGGRLIIDFDVVDKIYKNVVLTGTAQFIYQGSIEVF